MRSKKWQNYCGLSWPRLANFLLWPHNMPLPFTALAGQRFLSLIAQEADWWWPLGLGLVSSYLSLYFHLGFCGISFLWFLLFPSFFFITFPFKHFLFVLSFFMLLFIFILLFKKSLFIVVLILKSPWLMTVQQSLPMRSVGLAITHSWTLISKGCFAEVRLAWPMLKQRWLSKPLVFGASLYFFKKFIVLRA